MGLKSLFCDYDCQAAEHVSVFPIGEFFLVWADLGFFPGLFVPARTAVMKLPSYLNANKDEFWHEDLSLMSENA
jgi:hypothetical protein